MRLPLAVELSGQLRAGDLVPGRAQGQPVDAERRLGCTPENGACAPPPLQYPSPASQDLGSRGGVGGVRIPRTDGNGWTRARTQSVGYGACMSADFDHMTTDEQIVHVQDLWDRIASRPENIEVSDAWRHELARRSAELKANPDSAVPWEDVRAEIRARLGRTSRG